MTVLYFVLAAFALGVLVFFHELGHYLVAKWVGMTVETFSIGFGNPILKWRWKDTDWQLGWLLFGAYVKIKGMELSKKEKGREIDPYDIPDGFFAHSPLKRMLVIIAGPLTNFILAFLFFALIWVSGGRAKPFAEYTQYVGWVDPNAEIYALGVRPGDKLVEYNGKPFHGPKDLIYAAMLGGKKVDLKGYHIDYKNNKETPFSYKIETYPANNSGDGVLTTGITGTASYLIYDRFSDGTENPLPEGSPMQKSGIQYKDRLVWADGQILFSLPQLTNILNDKRTFLTVQRGDQIFFARQPRVLAGDLALDSHIRDEIMDWQYAAGIHGKWQDLFVLPFVVNSERYIEAPINFIDQENQATAFPTHPYSSELECPLQPGDQILAVDGLMVDRGYDILKQLQSHKVRLIVEKNVPILSKNSWKIADHSFEKSIHYNEIQKLAQGIGTRNELKESENFVLLNPIEPKKKGEFDTTGQIQEERQANYEKEKEQALKIKDRKKRAQALAYVDQSYQRVVLGIALQDQIVRYNPTPMTLFVAGFTETWQTLAALLTGSLHPKWLSGPIGIVQVIHHGWSVGLNEALFWIGAISLNLAVMNLLPIPVLDGGYICLNLWEMLTGRRLKAKTMERLIVPFIILLLALFIFLTFQDVIRLF